ncbi:MAG: DNA polymerase/3'-5' exonuclease PolX [Nitriliruptorales bacterium]|nr:DNA polymerase/3'-5' exonuclease PolX [Nitriliruptorales bacterium]
MRANENVVRLLKELATLTEIDEQSRQAFRVRAYENAARAVETLGRDVSALSASQLADIKGIGRSTAAKIRQAVEQGTIDKLEELRAKHPAGKVALLKVPGLGPKGVALLESELGVVDLDGLRAALEDGSIADLPGMGEKTAHNLREAIDKLGLSSKEQRFPIAKAHRAAERLVDDLRGLDVVERAEYAGSLRRFRETIGDVDILVVSTDAAAVMDAFVSFDDVDSVLARGATKSSVVTRDGLQVDLRVVAADEWGCALVYFTGSKAHNIRLRQRALDRHLTLNEYELAPTEGSRRKRPIRCKREEDVYTALDLPWIAPELREDTGEIEAAEAGRLPDLLAVEDLKGDLHDHSDWSGDGTQPMTDMIEGALARGLEYLAFTDHAEDLSINGVSKAGMKQQRGELRTLQEHHPDIRLLHGVELNIDADGSVDYDPGFVQTFDWCVASVHSHFRRPVAEQTRRVIAAMRNPAINVIGHLTGRRIGSRPGIDLDIDAVLDAAVETGTALEINCNLARLDAPVEVIREGMARGVTFVISTDAHAVVELDNHRHGVRQARRAGLGPDLVANTWPVDRFLDWAAAVRAGK